MNVCTYGEGGTDEVARLCAKVEAHRVEVVIGEEEVVVAVGIDICNCGTAELFRKGLEDADGLCHIPERNGGGFGGGELSG